MDTTPDTQTTTAIVWTQAPRLTYGKVGKIQLFTIGPSLLRGSAYQLETTLPGLKRPDAMETLEDCKRHAERLLTHFLRHLTEHGAAVGEQSAEIVRLRQELDDLRGFAATLAAVAGSSAEALETRAAHLRGAAKNVADCMND